MGSSTSNFTKPEEVEQGGLHVFELHMPSAAYSGIFVIFFSLLLFFGVYFCLKKCNLCKRFFPSSQNAPPSPYQHPLTGGEQPHGKSYLHVRPGKSGSYSVHMPGSSLSGVSSHNVNRQAAQIAPPPPTDHIYSPPPPVRRNSILSLLEAGQAASASK